MHETTIIKILYRRRIRNWNWRWSGRYSTLPLSLRFHSSSLLPRLCCSPGIHNKVSSFEEKFLLFYFRPNLGIPYKLIFFSIRVLVDNHMKFFYFSHFWQYWRENLFESFLKFFCKYMIIKYINLKKKMLNEIL